LDSLNCSVSKKEGRLSRVRVSVHHLAVELLSRHLHQLDPGIRWEIVPFIPEHSLADLDDGLVDVVIGYQVPQRPIPSYPHVSTRVFVREPVWVATAADGQYARRVEISLNELVGEIWVAQPSGPLRDLLVEACRKAAFDPDIRYSTSDNQVIRQLVGAGRAVTLSAPAVRDRNNVRIVPLREFIYRTCYVAWNPDRMSDQWAELIHDVVVAWYLERAQECQRYWDWLADPEHQATHLLELRRSKGTQQADRIDRINA